MASFIRKGFSLTAVLANPKMLSRSPTRDHTHTCCTDRWRDFCCYNYTTFKYKAPQYMIDCCIYTSDIARRQHLRSASCRQLLVPRHRRSMFGRWAFSVAGPAAWNSLPYYLREPTRSVDSFCRDLKTLLFSFY